VTQNVLYFLTDNNGRLTLTIIFSGYILWHNSEPVAKN